MGRAQNVNPPELGPANGFSHATRAAGLVWLGSPDGADSSGHIQKRGDIAAQFGIAVKNVRTALAAAGCQPSDVVSITYLVTDLAAYRSALLPIGKTYREVFGHHYPVAVLIGVTALFDPDATVEIECIAIGSKADA